MEELPVRLLLFENVADAISCLRHEKIHTVISRWELVDMENGEFLKRVREAKPAMPTIAFVRLGDMRQEISARSLGVSVVLPEDIDNDHFRESVCQLLKLKRVENIKTIDGNSEDVGYLETIEEFTHNQPINSGWTASFMIIIYALYKHTKTL